MKEQDLTKLTIEELKAKEKMMKRSCYAMLTAMLLMLLSGIFLSINKGFNVFTILPVAFLPLVVVFSNQLKAIKGELNRRDQ